MLNWVVRSALENRAVVVLGAGVLLVVGLIVALQSPLDVFPEFAPPLVEVQTEAPGMSSEAVENLVSVPVESAVNGVPGMTELRSKSVQGLSSVQMVFEPGTDMVRARQMVSERVAVVTPGLPENARNARVLPPLSSTSRVLKIGVTSKKLSQTELSVIAEWVIEPRLRAVPGVANISIWGLKRKEYQILVRPEVLRDRGVSLAQVRAAGKQAAAYGSAGYVDTANQRLALQYSSPVDDVKDLNKAVVADRDGRPILLGEVAELRIGNPPDIGEGVVNDQAGLLIIVEKFPEANTLEVTRRVEAELDKMRPGLQDVEVTTGIFRPATFIEKALGNLRFALMLGCVLVALILVAFLWEWRTAVISLTAIPLSLVAAVVLMRWLGGTLNTMVLAGLVIAIGEVVDDAIIDVENILRRLRQHGAGLSRESAFNVVLAASLEVRSAVVYASLIVVLVCLPIFFMGGVAGSFFRPLAMAYILAILASLVVALTVTPALSLMLLRGKVIEARRDPLLVRLVKAGYRRVLPAVMAWPRLTLVTPAVLLLGAALLYPQLKEEYLPRFQETDFLLHWIARPGTSIDHMRKDIEVVSKELRRETPVNELGAHIARAEIGDEVVGTNFAELWVSIGDVEDHAEARRQIESVTDRHSGMEHDLLTYLQERIKEVLSGAGAAIVIRLYGPDTAELRRLADAVRRAIEGEDGRGRVEGVADLRVESQVLIPQLQLVLDPDKLAQHGLTAGAVLENLSVLVGGIKVGEVRQQQRSFDVVVWGHPEARSSAEQIEQVPIELPNGKGTVPLSALGQVRRASVPNVVRHVQTSRCIDVLCNVRGRDLGGVARDVEERLATVKRPTGYTAEVLGEYKARQDNQTRMAWLTALAVLGIAVLLYLDFQSLRLTLLTLLTLPLALVGGVVAVWLTTEVVSLGSLVGFVTVLGIAARNGIMLISHYRHLQVEEKIPFGPELIVRGAEERVAPILMTALAAGLGLLPLALGGNKPGYEIEYPMAVVILGGLVSSTLLNLLVVPVAYLRFGQPR